MKTASRACRRFTGHRHHSRYGRFSVTHQRLVELRAFTRASPRVASRRRTPVATTEVQNASRPEVIPLARVLLNRRQGRNRTAMTVTILVVKRYMKNGTSWGDNQHGDNPAEPTIMTETEASSDRPAGGEGVTNRGPRLQIHSLQRGHRHHRRRTLCPRCRCLRARHRLQWYSLWIPRLNSRPPSRRHLRALRLRSRCQLEPRRLR